MPEMSAGGVEKSLEGWWRIGGRSFTDIAGKRSFQANCWHSYNCRHNKALTGCVDGKAQSPCEI